MKPNRSIPSSGVIPVLTYPDVRAAVAWLEDTFGFVERTRIGEDHRSQMRAGNGDVIIADVSNERVPAHQGQISHSVMVRVDDVQSHYEHSKAQGAQVIGLPSDFPFGERQYTVDDLAGHRWTFSQTLEDVEPESWGGVTVNP